MSSISELQMGCQEIGNTGWPGINCLKNTCMFRPLLLPPTVVKAEFGTSVAVGHTMPMLTSALGTRELREAVSKQLSDPAAACSRRGGERDEAGHEDGGANKVRQGTRALGEEAEAHERVGRRQQKEEHTNKS